MHTFDPTWLEKLESLREKGVNPFPDAGSFPITHLSTDLFRLIGEADDPSTVHSDPVSMSGRVMFRNRMGKAMFLRIQDRGLPNVESIDREGKPIVRGGSFQLYIRKDRVGDEAFETLKNLDIGDFVWAQGILFRTKTGELSLKVDQASLAAKTLRPFPDRWNSLTDTQTRSRQRYVDLFMNESTRDTFRKRSKAVALVRRFFDEREYMEVETPMLHSLPGGAAARPFGTHHNALDIPLFLRIAPELYLKRLVVGGFERVFEINRNFRNEGVSLKHNPEFTMLEFYQAWATVEDMIDLTQALIVEIAEELNGSLVSQLGEETIDFTPPFAREDFGALICKYTGLNTEDIEDAAAMEAFWRSKHDVAQGEALPVSRGKWWEHLFDEYVEHHLVQPTFVTGYPAEISPLARRNDEDPSRVDRFELFAGTWEIANAFTELNDPVDQAGRFAAQAAARAAGDAESMYFDRDYIRALSYGMPPTAGEGLGIDRLVMLLTGKTSIREVILFPTLRPEKWGDESESDDQ